MFSVSGVVLVTVYCFGKGQCQQSRYKKIKEKGIDLCGDDKNRLCALINPEKKNPHQPDRCIMNNTKKKIMTKQKKKIFLVRRVNAERQRLRLYTFCPCVG